MSEEEVTATLDAELPAEAASSPDDEAADAETEIRDTDIQFDCPHCGHNLVIDYRGAGLQITCVNCGQNVLVPIPDGMKIDDLDIEPGEILKQLFAARRHIQKAEHRIAQLQEELSKMTIRRDTLQAMLEFTKVQIGELKALNRRRTEMEQKAATHLDRIESDLNADMADEVAFADGDGREDGAPST